MDNVIPIAKRHVILDALRGFALLGICMANFPEFSLYSFLPVACDSSSSVMGVLIFKLTLAISLNPSCKL